MIFTCHYFRILNSVYEEFIMSEKIQNSRDFNQFVYILCKPLTLIICGNTPITTITPSQKNKNIRKIHVNTQHLINIKP